MGALGMRTLVPMEDIVVAFTVMVVDLEETHLGSRTLAGRIDSKSTTNMTMAPQLLLPQGSQKQLQRAVRLKRQKYRSRKNRKSIS